MKYLLLLVIISLQLHALSPNQEATKNLVLKESAKYTKETAVMAAICLTESSYGHFIIGDSGRSVGIMQMQVPTARFAANLHKDYTWLSKHSDSRIKTILLINPTISIHLASIYFDYHLKRRGLKYAIRQYNGYVAYNLGYYHRVTKNKQNKD